MFSFSRQQRLLCKKDFSRVFDKANKIVNSDFVVLFSNNHENCARLGLAISKKTIRRAHERNRIKRLIRESFRHTEFKSCVDIVFMARTGVDKASNQQIFLQLTKTWRKINRS